MSHGTVGYRLLAMVLLLMPVAVPAQVKRSIATNESYLERQMKLMNKTASVNYEKEDLACLRINDSTLCIYSNDRAFLYLGTGEEARRGRSAFADGYGMARYASRNAATGEMQFQYCLCPWKRGSRHGDGMIQLPDGTVLKARWNWDQLKSLSDQVPSEEELEEFSRRLARLEAVLRLLGWNNRY